MWELWEPERSVLRSGAKPNQEDSPSGDRNTWAMGNEQGEDLGSSPISDIYTKWVTFCVLRQTPQPLGTLVT